MINVIILALVLVNLVLSVLLVFTFVPSVNKTSVLVDKICKIVDLDVNGSGQNGENVSIEDLEYIPVTFADGDSQVFNLKQSGNSVAHIKLGVTIVVNKKHDDYKSKLDSLKASMNYISGKIGDIMLEYTATEANDNKKVMERRVLKMIQELIASDVVYDISFTRFIISA